MRNGSKRVKPVEEERGNNGRRAQKPVNGDGGNSHHGSNGDGLADSINPAANSAEPSLLSLTPLTQLTDEELVQLAQMGDSRATEHLLTKFKQLVSQQARPYYLAGADNEDLIQEGMIGLFKAIRDFSARKSNSFPAFATLCVKRQILSAVKMANRLKYIPLNSAHSLDQPAEDSDMPLAETLTEPAERGAEEVWMDKVTTRLLRGQIRRLLSPLEYQSITMYASGLTYHEIAQRLGRTSECIDRALFRGKRKIKKILVEVREG